MAYDMKLKPEEKKWSNERTCAYCGKTFLATSEWVYRFRRKWACSYTHRLRLEEQMRTRARKPRQMIKE